MGKRAIWTPSQGKTLVELVEGGEHTWREIAERVDHSISACRRKYARLTYWKWRDPALDRSNEDMRGM